MSGKRLSKRQLREQQDLQALAGPAHEEKGSEATIEREKKDDDLSEVIEEDKGVDEEDKIGGGIFAQLGQITEFNDASASGSEVDEDEKGSNEVKKVSKKKKKPKKKKKSTAHLEEEEANSSNTNGTNTPQKLTTAKTEAESNLKDAKSRKDVAEMSMDEFSALLDSQAALDKESGTNKIKVMSDAKMSGPLPSFRAHLALSAPFLDPTVELKRQFGAAAIKAYESEASSANQSRGGGAANAARARAMAWNTNFKVKSILVQPQDTWPPIAKTFTGMTMETIEDDVKGKVGGWVHSKAYRKAQLQFLQAVQSYEPNHLISLLRLYPWHIDTLLQLSEVSRHQGDLGAASDWNSRALFAYERTSTTVFSSSLTSSGGPPLLSFDRIEDRGFWIASHRHVNFLGRRGTWRTALEWVKLMLGIDPTYDHHGMILWLDFLSIKSRQYRWFLECLEKLEIAYSAEMESRGDLIVNAKTPIDSDKDLIGEGKPSREALDWCLGCAYARALALRAIEKEEGDKLGQKSTAALRIAIARHPHLLPSLFEKIGLTFPSEMSSSPLFNVDSVNGNWIPQILTHIYVSRSESLWRDSNTSTWLLNTLQEVFPILEEKRKDICLPSADVQSCLGIYRHILVSDLPDALRQTLIGLIPRQITSDSSKLNAYDPLPPNGPNVTYYNDDYFEAVTREQSQRHRNQGSTDAGIMNQFMNAIRGVQGLEAWGNVMENMDDDAREDVMAQMLQLTTEAGQRGEMPGAFNDARDRQGQDENQVETGTGPFAALRGILGRLWGEERTEAALQQNIDDTGDGEDDDNNDA